MKIKLLAIVCVVFLFSCNKIKYDCTVVTDLGGFGKATTERTFKGTYNEMLDFEKSNTTDKKITTCH